MPPPQRLCIRLIICIFAKICGVISRVSWCDVPLCYFRSRKRLEYARTEKTISTIIEQVNWRLRHHTPKIHINFGDYIKKVRLDILANIKNFSGVSWCDAPLCYFCGRKKTLRYAKRERQHRPAAQAAAGLRGVDSPPRKVFSSRWDIRRLIVFFWGDINVLNKKNACCSCNIIKILWIQKKYVSLQRQSSESERGCRLLPTSLFWEMAGDRHNEKTLS